MENVLRMYIGGEWKISASGQTRNIINPANGEIIAVATEGNKDDVKLAVKAAKKAFYDDGWIHQQ